MRGPLNNEMLHSDDTDDPNLSWFSRLKNMILKYYQLIANESEAFGLFILFLSQLFNTVMITTCKLLIIDEDFETPIHPLQILFVRMAITYICCVLYMVITRSVPDAPFGKPEIRKWLFIRGCVGFMGVFGMYFSLLYLSVSDAVAITFLIPLVTAFLAWVVLHERYTLFEAICSLISLGGVILIAKPNFIFGAEADKETDPSDINESSSTEKRVLATGVGLLGVLGASSVYIILRKIGNKAHPLISVSYFALSTVIVTTTAISIIPSISFTMPQNSYQWLLFIIIGIAGFLYQFALTAGVQRVKASKASLVIYTQMIFAILGDLIILHHLPSLLSILGIAIIIGSTLVVLRYKPALPSSDEENHMPLSQTEDENTYKPEEIQLQDFMIDDDDDDDLTMDPENELNSVKFSNATVKLNDGFSKSG